MKILVSACLLGVACRYDGCSKGNECIQKCNEELDFIPVCPEQLGGLATPRPPAKFFEGDGESAWNHAAILKNENLDDVMPQYLRGAQETLKIAQLFNIRLALLKEKSPSCGSTRIHQNETYIPGKGVTTALLQQHGITVFSEEQLEAFAQYLEEYSQLIPIKNR